VGGAVLAAAAIAVYSRTFSVPLLYDDHAAIAGNATIRHWTTAFFPPINTTTTGRPILNFSLAINHAISGTAVWSYHALNLAIHVLAAQTLFGIVRRTLRLRSGQALAPSDATLVAFAASLLWTLHPLQTESVTYVIQRAESLMGLFYLLTLYCFIRATTDAESGLGKHKDTETQSRHGLSQDSFVPLCLRGSRRFSVWWFALSFFACLLGMGTKEVMVSAPLIVLLYDRTFVAGSFREAWRRRWGVHAALAATWLPLAGLVAGAGWDRNGTSGFDVGITPWAYWLTQFEAVTRYLWLSVWPHPLVFEYGTFWVHRPAEAALYALVVVMLLLAVLVALWRRPALGFLGAWFFVILAPTSVMPGQIQMIVEHRMYLPLAAVTTLAAIGIYAALRRQSWVVFTALALGLGLLAARRNEDYRSELAIWSDTVATRPNNERALVSLGNAWLEMPGHLNDAIAQYEAALRLKPDLAEAHYTLGVAWAHSPERLNDAIAQYEEALRLKPDYAEAHNNLGNALNAEGRTREAIAQCKEALRLKPDLVEAHNNLGNALTAEGRTKEAIAEYEAALRLKPDLAEAHNNLGYALEKMPGRLNDAVAQYKEALRLKPDYAEAHNNLGNALNDEGRTREAVAEYEAALRLKPDYGEAHNNLGYDLEKIPGRLNDAIVQYEAALRLNPDDAVAHYNLGNALNAEGRTREASTHYEAALRLKPDYAEAHTNLGYDLAQMPGRLNDAVAQYEEALRLKPDDAAAHFNLAVALLEIPGRRDEATAHIEAVLRLQPENEPAQKVLARIRASRP
jgi:tetratricopeptide (TPR) repeat protein